MASEATAILNELLPLKKLMSVFARFEIEALHAWEDAPDDYAILRSKHRHMFHFDVGIHVDENNRQCEFIFLKKQLLKLLPLALSKRSEQWGHNNSIIDWGNNSCEMIVEETERTLRLLGYTPAFIKVSEDGENGAFATYARQ